MEAVLRGFVKDSTYQGWDSVVGQTVNLPERRSAFQKVTARARRLAHPHKGASNGCHPADSCPYTRKALR